MPTFSIISASKKEGNRISGSWIQDHIGTLETASALADRYQEDANTSIFGGHYVVTKPTTSVVAALTYHTNMEVLYDAKFPQEQIRA